jgi:hypothetical protein
MYKNLIEVTMSTFLLRFGIVIIDNESEFYQFNKLRHHGPLFHRWIPNGETDAIELSTGEEDAFLQVWFERRGFVEEGLIKFHPDRLEVDETLIPKQGILDAGPLFGLLKICNLSSEDLETLDKSKTEYREHKAFGKRVVSLIYAPVSRFIKTLRTNYGQYWLKDLAKWDSRDFSLGYYFDGIIQSKYSVDDGKTWFQFRPTKYAITESAIASILPYNEYLTEEDWKVLQNISKLKYEPSAATEILARAYKFLKQDRIKQAVIEGVTALEIAINEVVRQALGNNAALLKSIQAFWQLPLPTQVVTLTSITGGSPLQDVESAIKIIEIRNKAVHEGLFPLPENTKEELTKLLKVTANLLPSPKLKFPSYDTRNNEIKTAEEWDKSSKRRMSMDFKIAVVPDLLKNL